MIDRRLRDRDADKNSRRRLQKLFAGAIIGTLALYLVLKLTGAIH